MGVGGCEGGGERGGGEEEGGGEGGGGEGGGEEGGVHTYPELYTAVAVLVRFTISFSSKPF